MHFIENTQNVLGDYQEYLILIQIIFLQNKRTWEHGMKETYLQKVVIKYWKVKGDSKKKLTNFCFVGSSASYESGIKKIAHCPAWIIENYCSLSLFSFGQAR